MEKNYNHKEYEEKIYSLWEKSGAFTPKIDKKKKPYTIVLPPPNASGKMHTGNVLMIAIEDLLIRWKRMQGYSALWIPGTDHAGTETQITFEKMLAKEGKSRFNYSREELYQEIWNFVESNKSSINQQMKKMGASVDWNRYKFTLDPDVVKTVHNTFEKMHKDNLLYRANHIVNYCVKCGTTYADIELKHEERKDSLYYLKYGPFVLATVRPETKFGDTAVAVHPKDKRYQNWVGKKIDVEGLNGKFSLNVIADNFVDPKFGTGVVKVTPAHDKNDFEAGLRHNLEVKPVIDMNGKLNENAGKYAGLSVFEGRKQVVNDLAERGLMDHIDNKYLHSVTLCKAGHEIEPMVLPNWFVKVDDPKKSFKKPAYQAVKDGKVSIYPKWQTKKYLRWMEEMRDWPVSRQNVWGIQIPVWYEINKNDSLRVLFKFEDVTVGGEIYELLNPDPTAAVNRTFVGNKDRAQNENFAERKFTLKEIRNGLQRVIASIDTKYKVQLKSPGENYLPDTDTFDTWFSSGHWPLVTLGYPDSTDFKYFYPTAVLETGWEIIRLWVSRMVMFGIYLTGETPFKEVYLHGIVKALDGRKMSKSLGNVINPEEYQEQYGTDALRMGLVLGTSNGKDFNFPKDRVIAFRNFANKIWNIARFIQIMFESAEVTVPYFSDEISKKLKPEDKAILKKLDSTIKKVDTNLDKYRFADAADAIYHYMWEDIASGYLEQTKGRTDKDVNLSVLRHVYINSLKLLHPFMPFITEAVWQETKGLRKHPEELLINAAWPQV